MRVVVDMNRCESNAICMGIAPEIFELNDDDLLVMLDDHPQESQRGLVLKAINQCPKQAISIEED